MPQASAEKFREILKNDDYPYVLTSKTSEPIDINYPNMPEWHKKEFEEWRHEILPDATVLCFEYNGSNYKLLSNMGDADCNDGTFGALFDGNNDKILDILSTGDMETTVQSLIADEKKIGDDFVSKLSAYLKFFRTILANKSELEYVAFKVLAENRCLYDIDDIDMNEYDEDEEYIS